MLWMLCFFVEFIVCDFSSKRGGKKNVSWCRYVNIFRAVISLEKLYFSLCANQRTWKRELIRRRALTQGSKCIIHSCFNRSSCGIHWFPRTSLLLCGGNIICCAVSSLQTRNSMPLFQSVCLMAHVPWCPDLIEQNHRQSPGSQLVIANPTAGCITYFC